MKEPEELRPPPTEPEVSSLGEPESVADKTDVQSTEENRELAEQHTYLIRKVINQIGLRLPPYVQREDLIGVAALGLLDAAKKYDEARGKRFSVYAEYRIRGAILDELRHRDPMPRVLRGKAKRMEQAIDELTRGLGRPPEDDEVAGAMGLRLTNYHDMRLTIERANTVAFSETVSQGYGSGPSAQGLDLSNNGADSTSLAKTETVDGEAAYGPLRRLMKKERVAALADAISELDTRDQLILSLHYREDLNFRQIGEILKLTESRISQLHKGALLALKDKLER